MIHGYVRVSTEDQAREGRSSPEDQERRIRAIAALRDDGEPTMWRDLGVSGATPLAQRPDGGRLIAALQPGDVVVAAKLDRLFRNTRDALTQSEYWQTAGVDLILIDMGTESVLTSSTGRLYFTMLAAFATFERERIAERIGDGRKAKRQRGGFTGGHPPTGYEVTGQGAAALLTPNRSERAMVARARLLTFTVGPTKAARILTAEGYRSRAGTPITAAQVWRWHKRDYEAIS